MQDGVTAAAASHADGLSGKASGGVQANPPTPAARLVRALTRQASKAGSRHEAEEPSQETEFERQARSVVAPIFASGQIRAGWSGHERTESPLRLISADAQLQKSALQMEI